MRPRRLQPPLQSRPSWWLEEARAHHPAGRAGSRRGSSTPTSRSSAAATPGSGRRLALHERDSSLRIASAGSERDRRRPQRPQRRLPARLLVHRCRPFGAVLGDDAALQLRARARPASCRRCVAFCESRGEDVRLREGGLLRVSAGVAEDAERRASGRNRPPRPRCRGRCAELLDASELRRRCDSPRFRKAVHFRDGAIVQPARLALHPNDSLNRPAALRH